MNVRKLVKNGYKNKFNVISNTSMLNYDTHIYHIKYLSILSEGTGTGGNGYKDKINVILNVWKISLYVHFTPGRTFIFYGQCCIEIFSMKQNEYNLLTDWYYSCCM